MKVLAIDTSNYTLGVSLLDGEAVVGEYITNIKKNHAVRLMPSIEMLLQQCDVKAKDLNKIVVAQGPGSYTGVRIGVTTAKTLAWSLQIPLSGVSSLAVLAANGRGFEGYICPLFDARRQQVFTGLYTYGQTLETVKQDRLMLIQDWLTAIQETDKRVLFIGNDVDIHRGTIQAALGDRAVFAGSTLHNPRPSELGLLGLHAEEADVHTFVPNYLRLAEAEATWLANQNK
ncbi:tRNA (adenosine(37)-N6)-threonylcarbamoyltransferase complex dimerization subunit type 1 TsaB [Ectobacillus antri]|jgi:tRNA threonylcarbamoyladenosine biosynthesis protein TsaB|uniref:tRNA (Adenosine(37)-N6)-threonylcarbamoyltransferase complex dimerization subunit type 1 TsaB n=1 Tax=Ectobacillus antri TaxID=2486280 RepID=A0ABT6H9Q3_9BACI|nr:tRNA (adenosine(37)-N6)-threonylcarbamoyltransferase complex dimerization subunit type 1 TsaB [Ectobacillus antri]MDG4658326.1 tRNA (adenosine(37)-N6)-threonylcarbamoyltransferase complex dimerization subunit type 1 TsaB [Ectobacillus antri]MDG5755397.1 tRNA (adenosine(37)-N6)-threonylcarbamoyltransferase complex dimerization subunit type 1 TsaB [Ectobacillus antri]